MHKMHGVDRGKSRPAKQKQKQKQQQQQQQRQQHQPSSSAAAAVPSSDQPKHQQKRTGLVINEEQRRRIAARAAKEMEKIRRRRKHRTSLAWGERSKEDVPQTLTPDELHYEFPPRSRLLKKLASANAERRRLQPNPNPSLAHPYNELDLAATATAPSTTTNLPALDDEQHHLPPPTIQPTLSPPKPDPLAIDEWFSSRKRHQKDRDVIEWIDNVEKSKHLLSPSMGHTPGTSENGNDPSLKIQFRSEAGKRWANQSSSSYPQAHQQQQHTSSSSSVSPLAPPPESSDKHYVPRHLLRPRHDEASATRIQAFWRGYRERKKPVGGMVRLVGMFHLALEQHQRAAQERFNHLEGRLADERRLREQHQTRHASSQQRLDELLRSHHQHSSLDANNPNTKRLVTLEQTVQHEVVAREQLNHSVSAALQQMNLLEKSIQHQAEQSRITRKNLQKQLDSVISEIRTIRSARR